MASQVASYPDSDDEDDASSVDSGGSDQLEDTSMAVDGADHQPVASGSGLQNKQSTSTNGSVKKKEKLSRVSRACLLCRKAKMKCTGGLEPPCNRCKRHNTECQFIESRRGKATKASRLAKAMAEQMRARGLDPSTINLPPPAPVPVAGAKSITLPVATGGSFSASHLSTTVSSLTGTPKPDASISALTSAPPASTSSALNFFSSLTMPALSPSSSTYLPHTTPLSLPEHSASIASSLVLPSAPTSTAASTSSEPKSKTKTPRTKSISIASSDKPALSGSPAMSASFALPPLAPPPTSATVSNSTPLISASHLPSPKPASQPPISHSTTSLLNPTSPQLQPIPQLKRSQPRPQTSPPLPSPGPSIAHPMGVLVEAAASSHAIPYSRAPSEHGGDVEEMGIASSNYFFGAEERNGLGEENEVLRVLDYDDIVELFNIFFDHVHIHNPMIDREHSSPAEVLQRSPVLFNAICCVSAKYYTSKPEILPAMRQLAKAELAKFPMEKNLEIVQAQVCYMIWAPLPAVSFEKDMNWVRTGLAIRIALDLNLHRAETIYGGKIPDWRVRSMRRTWLVAMQIEKTVAVQLNKPSILWSQGAEYAATDSPSHSIEDMRVLTHCEYNQLIERSLDSIQLTRSYTASGGAHESVDVHTLFQRQLEGWRKKGEERERARDAELSETAKALQRARFKLYFGYAQLVIASVGLQHILESDSSEAAFALAKYQAAALSILHVFRDEWGPPEFSHYCNDFQFSYVLYASVSLLKSVQPQFKHSLVDKVALGELIFTVVTLLEDAARSWDHLPFLQAKFLRRVLKARLPEFTAPPRAPLPARLARQHRAPPVTEESGILQPHVSPETMNPFNCDQDDLWLSNDFTDTTFGRSDLFQWDDFLGFN
ncbi:hypothetical protein T439DRAFT_328698 [Meredithblackwellia eburnea MCA 4105]